MAKTPVKITSSTHAKSAAKNGVPANRATTDRLAIHKPKQTGARSAERGGRAAEPSELTELERRVLAHERILQALIGHLANDDGEILLQLKLRFGSGHNLGEYEQDFVSTEHFGDHFIRRIEGEVTQRNAD